MKLILIFLGTLFVAAPAWSAGDAQAAYNRVRFEAQASGAVANDLMRVELAAEAQGPDPAAVAGGINEAMRWAVAEARKIKGIEMQTGAYYTAPTYLKGELKHWRGSQRLILSGRDREGLTRLMGVLQRRLAVKAVSFRVSDASRERLVERLTGEAIRAFRTRAGRITKEFGAKGYRLVTASIGTGGREGGPVPLRAQALTAAESVPPPALEAGKSRITVTVAGTIELEM